MQVSVVEKVTMDSSAQGGVVNLLRMARAQCGVAVAFAALRNADGTFALATFPQLGAETEWTVEAVDELVHQTWADPHLSGGRVLVRTGRLPGEHWPGQNHQVKLAVAPLSDLTAADRPWGLLCVAEPASGNFDQDHLDLLGTMAARLTSYLRARQEVVENVFTVVHEERPSPAEDLGAPEGAEPGAATPAGAPEAPSPSPRPASEPPSPSPRPAPEAPSPSPRPAPEPPRSVTGPPPPPGDVPERTVVHSEALLKVAASVPVVEWYRGAGAFPPITPPPPPAPTSPPPTTATIPAVPPPAPSATTPTGSAASGPAPTPSQAPPTPAVGVAAPPPREAPPAPAAAAVPHRPLLAEAPHEPGEDLGAVLGVDPLTGLPRLPAVLVHLGGALGTLRRSAGGCVALVLIDLRCPGPIPETLLRALAERLGDLVRTGDLLGRIGRGTFAVVAEVRTGSGDAAAIERRLVGASQGVAAETPAATVRSALTWVGADSVLGAEDVLRRAIAQMGDR